MTDHKIKYRKESRPVSSLRLHPIIETIGFVPPDIIYKTELRYLGLYKEIVVTETGECLNMPDMLLAAIEMEIEYVNVLVIESNSEHTWLRLINFDNRNIYRGSKTRLYKTIKLLQEHLWNTVEGKKWYQELPGDNINEKIGALVGYKSSTVSNIKYIGDKQIHYLEQVDDPESDMNLAQARVLVDSEEKLNQKNDNYNGVEISSLTGGSVKSTVEETENRQGANEDSEPIVTGNANSNELTTGHEPCIRGDEKPKPSKKWKAKEAIVTDELTSFSVGFRNTGQYSLVFTDGVPAIIRDGEHIGDVIIEPGGNNNIKEELRYVFLSKDMKWSFHIVATRINNTIKQKEVESSKE